MKQLMRSDCVTVCVISLSSEAADNCCSRHCMRISACYHHLAGHQQTLSSLLTTDLRWRMASGSATPRHIFTHCLLIQSQASAQHTDALVCMLFAAVLCLVTIAQHIENGRAYTVECYVINPASV